MNIYSPHRGFTLIELLVVIAIIGVLSSIVLAALNSARMKANDAARAADIRSIKTAMELYYNDNHQYPQYLNPNTSYNIKKLGTILVPTYLPIMPQNLIDDFDDYTWAGENSYGLHIFTETAHNYCRTGVNVDPSWWGATSPPTCNF